MCLQGGTHKKVEHFLLRGLDNFDTDDHTNRPAVDTFPVLF